METIGNSEALGILAKGVPLVDRRVDGDLDLRALATKERVSVPVVIRRCILRGLSGQFLHFEEPVEFQEIRCEGNVDFYSSYLCGGFEARSCKFEGLLSFATGGHNKGDRKFVMHACEFHGFVDFFDCWFEGPVSVTACKFEIGANLLGNRGKSYVVRFDRELLVQDNSGSVDLDVNI